MSRNPSEDEDSIVTVPKLQQCASPEPHRYLAHAWSLAPARDPEIAAEKDFDELFKTHYEGVYRLLYRIVGTREEAEDLAQETFLRLHRANHLWNPHHLPAEHPHNIRGWLYRVASNLAYNALRGEGRRQRRQAEMARQALVTGRGEDDPAEMVVRGDDRQAVRRALASLSQQQAQLLLLRHAGLSYRELAEALGVAPGSVGTLLARAETAFEKSYLKQERPLGGQARVR
jgi:RNA polymerase sigma-70 factor (ECF subfamily)